MQQPKTQEAASDRAQRRVDASTWRIPLLYLLWGILWIVFSDRLLDAWVGDPALLTRMQTFKGAFFVVATAILLYALLRPMARDLLRSHAALAHSEVRYRELFEGNPNPMLVYDQETLQVLDGNAAAADFLGFRHGQLQGAALPALWNGGGLERLLAAVEATVQVPDHPCVALEALEMADGSCRDVELRSSDIGCEGRRARLIAMFDRSAERQAQRSREQALARLQEVQRIARLGSWELDPLSGHGDFGEVLQRILGHPAPAERWHDLGLVLAMADAASQRQLQALAAEVAAGEQEQIDLLLPLLNVDGRERLLRLRGQARADAQGKLRLRGTAQDVTEEEHTRRLLREREQQFRELMRMLPDGVMILAAERVHYANPACAAQFGHEGETLLGEALDTLVCAADLPRLREHLLHPRADSALPLSPAPLMLRRDGSEFRAGVTACDARYGGKDCTLLIVRDLTEPERMRDALAASNQELQAMARRLFSLQEDERRAISRDLHDDIGQAITAIKLSAHAAMDDDDAERRRDDLATIAATADATLNKLRNLSMLLRPPQLDALGLEAALRWQAGMLFRSAPVALELDIQPLPQRPEREREQACFRIAQECLTNVLRHSRAAQVRLSLHDEDGQGLHLCVHDDGDGFEPQAARGLGLVIMRERAQSAGGSLRIEAAPGAGTRIELRLPYEAPGDGGR